MKKYFWIYLIAVMTPFTWAQSSPKILSYKILKMVPVSAIEKDAFDELLTEVRSPQLQTPEAMLRSLTMESGARPLVWCAAPTEQGNSQVCTFRLEGLEDDSVAGEVKKIRFRQISRVWIPEKVETAWRCAEGRGKSDAYHTTTCQ
ncbi:MAG: hypothetical protein JNN12_02115 [Bacteroidetes Order II. Incertae sedis bacterium]|nr:hypothetical protein [Bacteroidetes Order II. bacterium]